MPQRHGWHRRARKTTPVGTPTQGRPGAGQAVQQWKTHSGNHLRVHLHHADGDRLVSHPEALPDRADKQGAGGGHVWHPDGGFRVGVGPLGRGHLGLGGVAHRGKELSPTVPGAPHRSDVHHAARLYRD
uniref:(northern house mosquito) hypothetical protein n=1 Tax=Culex pipiens TaxID=7175 RepID=A0A8D8BK77_CULPI